MYLTRNERTRVEFWSDHAQAAVQEPPEQLVESRHSVHPEETEPNSIAVDVDPTSRIGQPLDAVQADQSTNSRSEDGEAAAAATPALAATTRTTQDTVPDAVSDEVTALRSFRLNNSEEEAEALAEAASESQSAAQSEAAEERASTLNSSMRRDTVATTPVANSATEASTEPCVTVVKYFVKPADRHRESESDIETMNRIISETATEFPQAEQLDDGTTEETATETSFSAQRSPVTMTQLNEIQMPTNDEVPVETEGPLLPQPVSSTPDATESVNGNFLAPIVDRESTTDSPSVLSDSDAEISDQELIETTTVFDDFDRTKMLPVPSPSNLIDFLAADAAAEQETGQLVTEIPRDLSEDGEFVTARADEQFLASKPEAISSDRGEIAVQEPTSDVEQTTEFDPATDSPLDIEDDQSNRHFDVVDATDSLAPNFADSVAPTDNPLLDLISSNVLSDISGVHSDPDPVEFVTDLSVEPIFATIPPVEADEAIQATEIPSNDGTGFDSISVKASSPEPSEDDSSRMKLEDQSPSQNGAVEELNTETSLDGNSDAALSDSASFVSEESDSVEAADRQSAELESRTDEEFESEEFNSVRDREVLIERIRNIVDSFAKPRETEFFKRTSGFLSSVFRRPRMAVPRRDPSPAQLQPREVGSRSGSGLASDRSILQFIHSRPLPLRRALSSDPMSEFRTAKEIAARTPTECSLNVKVYQSRPF